MSEIGTLSLERLNNGAHFLFFSNVLARAEADANVKSKLSVQIVSLKAAMEQEDKDWKSRKKVCWQMTSLQPMHQGLCHRPKDATWQGNGTLLIIKYKYVKEFHFCVIFSLKSLYYQWLFVSLQRQSSPSLLTMLKSCEAFFVYTHLNMANLIPFTKRFESSETLVNLLESRGLQICDRNKAIQYLDNIGYYRLSAYMYQPVMVYDMNGRKVNNPGKGVYITNGMKIMKRQ